MNGKKSKKAQQSHGDGTSWKRKTIEVPVCNECKAEIKGVGSVVEPYQCECSLFLWGGDEYNRRMLKDAVVL